MNTYDDTNVFKYVDPDFSQANLPEPYKIVNETVGLCILKY